MSTSRRRDEETKRGKKKKKRRKKGETHLVGGVRTTVIAVGFSLATVATLASSFGSSGRGRIRRRWARRSLPMVRAAQTAVAILMSPCVPVTTKIQSNLFNNSKKMSNDYEKLITITTSLINNALSKKSDRSTISLINDSIKHNSRCRSNCRLAISSNTFLLHKSRQHKLKTKSSVVVTILMHSPRTKNWTARKPHHHWLLHHINTNMDNE